MVASYNGERTLKACLDSLERLNYPDYEVILVDDGSTDATPQIAFAHPKRPLLPPREEPRPLGGAQHRHRRRDGRDRRLHGLRLPGGRGLAVLSGGRLAGERIRGHGRPQPPAAGRFAGGRGGHGLAGRAGARDADRPPGRAHSRLQHGVLQMGAGADRRVRSDLPPGGRRRGPLLALAAGGLRRSVSARRRSSGITGARPSAPI